MSEITERQLLVFQLGGNSTTKHADMPFRDLAQFRFSRVGDQRGLTHVLLPRIVTDSLCQRAYV
eukprot:6182347-Pleurochrysis_carterae.AAC.1